jgi:hypothetical protein
MKSRGIDDNDQSNEDSTFADPSLPISAERWVTA